jgi:hypothetical protein
VSPPLDLRLEDGTVANSEQLAEQGGAQGAPGFATTGTVPAVATTQTLTTTVEVGPTGNVYWQVAATLGIGGGTAAAGDDMVLKAVAGVSAVLPVAGFTAHQAMGTNGDCSMSVIVHVGGLTPGASYTIGATASDATNAAHTFTWSSDGGAQLFWWTS